ncbi:MAG TPA: nitrile hydratase subunit beta [Stellaceae bacterium]|jgi:nitrile hydratase
MSNTVHDMGGMHGFGPVQPEENEPTFHAEWEGRVHAMQRAMGATGLWTIDGGRASLETLPPVEYLRSSYYRRWFLGLEQRLLKFGLVSEDEIAAGHSLRRGVALNRTLKLSDGQNPPIRGNFERPSQAPARFKVGDTVRARLLNPTTHTRLPRYARGKTCTIEAIRGCQVYPDTAALDVANEEPEWLYTVVFAGSELWGDAAEPGLTVSIDAFEPYLEAI